MARYFYSEIASRPLKVGDKQFKFDPTGIIGGKLTGVLALEDGADIAAVELAVRMRVGVIEISKEDYDAQQAQKKRVLISQPSSTSNSDPLPTLPLSMQQQTGHVRHAQSEEPEPSEIPSEELDPEQLITLGGVASPEAFVAEDQRSGSHPQKRKGASRVANVAA